jgi:dihydroxyacetone kinase-like predicted kinase
MGLLNREIVLTSRDKLDATCRLLDQMIDEESGIVTLIRGADTTEEEIERVNLYIEKHFEVDVEIQNGGQPVYSFIIGVE